MAKGRKSAGGGGRKGRTGGTAYPQDLTKMTKSQSKKFLSSLTDLSLEELRRRQDITAEQIASAAKRRLPIGNLRVMERMLDAAVDKVAFG